MTAPDPSDRERAVTVLAGIIAGKVPEEDPAVVRATAETLVDAAYQIRDGGEPEPGSDNLSSQLGGIELAAVDGHHVPGTSYDWMHNWRPITHSAAASHFGGHIPPRWRPPLLPAAGRSASFSTPQEFHANYLPSDRERLDKLKAEADRLGREAAMSDTTKARSAAYKAQDKYNSAVDAAIVRARGQAGDRAG